MGQENYELVCLEKYYIKNNNESMHNLNALNYNQVSQI